MKENGNMETQINESMYRNDCHRIARGLLKYGLSINGSTRHDCTETVEKSRQAKMGELREEVGVKRVSGGS